MYQPPKKSEIFLVTFMILASLAIIYGLYINNPYFMNTKPLSQSLAENKEAVVPVPEPKIEEGQKLVEQKLVQRNIQRSFQEPYEFDIGPSYIREYYRNFINDVELTEAPQWTMDDKWFYLSTSNKLYVVDKEQQLQWWFEAQEEDQLVGTATVSDDELFAVTKKGNVYQFDKATGRVNWMVPTKHEVVYSPLIYRSFLYYVQKRGEEEFYLVKMKGLNGEVEWSKKLIGFTKPSELTFNESTKLILITDPNGSLLCLDISNGNAYWQKKKLGVLEAPATAVGDMAFVANTEGIAYGIHLRRKTIVWEYELSAGTDQAFTYIPQYNYVAVPTKNGYLHMIDGKTGESQWRYNTHNEQKFSTTVALRLKEKYLLKYSLDRSQKGWVVLTPCVADRLCILNPDKGQLITRIRLRGQLGSPYLFDGADLLLTLLKPEKLPWSTSKEDPPPFALGKYTEYVAKKTPASPKPASEPSEDD